MKVTREDQASAERSPEPAPKWPAKRSGEADSSSRPPRWRAGLIADIVLPLIGYYPPHALGASDRTSLIIAACAAGARLLWEALRARRVTWFGAIMLAVFSAGAALSATGGDARMLLMKDSVGTALIGGVFLVSLVGKTPLTLAASQSWQPSRAEVIARLYREDPRVRRVVRVCTLGWGVGMIAESTIRVPLVYLLPIDVMVGLSTALMIVTMAALAVWNVIYVLRAVRRIPALEFLLPHGIRRR